MEIQDKNKKTNQETIEDWRRVIRGENNGKFEFK